MVRVAVRVVVLGVTTLHSDFIGFWSGLSFVYLFNLSGLGLLMFTRRGGFRSA